MGSPDRPAFNIPASEDAVEALRLFGFEAAGTPAHVASSVSNANFRVQSTEGTLFLRAHRRGRTYERVEREQAVIRWAAGAGLPVIPPATTPGGAPIVEFAGHLWSIYPWIEGRTLQRGSIAPEGARMLGRLLGRLHRVLAGYPREGPGRNSELRWDREASLADLALVGERMRERGAKPQWKQAFEEHLAMVDSGETQESSRFEWLPVQPTHGDFHERNVMLDGDGNVLAVVDWERFCLQPPAFEVLRAISFMWLLEEPLLRPFLEGYAAEHRLAAGTVAPAVDAWWQSGVHNTWAWRDFYLAGNSATEQFFAENAALRRRFNDRAYREWLAGRISALAG